MGACMNVCEPVCVWHVGVCDCACVRRADCVCSELSTAGFLILLPSPRCCLTPSSPKPHGNVRQLGLRPLLLSKAVLKQFQGFVSVLLGNPHSLGNYNGLCDRWLLCKTAFSTNRFSAVCFPHTISLSRQSNPDSQYYHFSLRECVQGPIGMRPTRPGTRVQMTGSKRVLLTA